MIPHQMGLIVRRAALARIGHAAVCGFLWLGLTAASARAGNVSWVIDADGQWTAASNWSSNPALPGPTDDVTIDVPGDRLITLTNSSQSIKSLISAERMVLTFGGTLNLGTTGQFNNTVTLSGGTLNGGTISFGNGGGLVIATNGSNVLSNLTINGDLNVGGGYSVVSGPLTFINGGNASIGSGGTLAYLGTALTLSPATYAIDGGTLGVYGQNATQTMTLTTDVTVRGRGNLGNYTNIGGPSLNLVNNGTITADVPGLTLAVAPQNTFTNNTTAQAIGGGILSINAGNWSNAAGGAITATASTLNLNGAWSNAGTITATNATVNLGGSFTTAGIGTFNRSGGQVNLTGNLDNTGATLNLNAGTGSWTLVAGSLSGGTLTQSGGAGLVIAANGSNRIGNLAINGDLNVGGGYTVVTGPLTFNGGTANVGAGGTLAYQGTSITLPGPATYAIDGGTIGVYGQNATQTLTVGTGVTVRGRGSLGNYTNIGGPSLNLVNNGTITADIAGQTLSVAPQNTFTNNGTAQAIGGATLNIAGNLNNAPGGTITATASTLNLNGAWNNAGTITATNATVNLAGNFTTANIGTINRTGGAVNLTGALDNTGATLNLNAGTGSWTLVGGSLTGGTLTQTGGAGLAIALNGSNRLANLTINGDLNVGGGYTLVSGPLAFNGGSANVGSGTISYQGLSPTVVGPSTYAIGGGTLGIYGLSTSQTLTLASGVTVHGWGNVGNYTNIGGSGNLVNGGTITADTAGQTLTVAPSNSFTNNGTTAASGGTLSITAPSFTNNGILQVSSGTLLLGTNVNFTAAAGSSFLITGGTAQLNHSVSVPQFDLPAGTLSGSGNFSTPAFNWTGGAMSGGGKTTVASGATMTISGAGAKTLSRTIDNSGTTSWTDGQILTSSGTFNNLAGGVFSVTAANSFFNSGGTNLFNNTGAFAKNSPSVTVFGIPFTNQAAGVVNVNDGTLALLGGGTNFGLINIANGATARFGGTFNHAAGSTLSGTGNIDFNTTAISLDGNLIIDGELTFNSASATVKAGATVTKLSLTGSSATVAAGGVLTVGSGGVNFTGSTNNTVTLQPSASTPGLIVLKGNVNDTATDGTAVLNTANFTTGQTPGLMDLFGGTRTFAISDGAQAIDLSVSGRVTNGGIIKSGTGTMRLDSPNTYAGGTTITAGTLEVLDTAGLSTGGVTIGDATLSLKSDLASPVTFGNNVTVTGDATIRVDRISVGNSGVYRLGNVSIGGTRLSVAGANRSLEIAGLNLSGSATLDTALPLAITGPITQSVAGMGITKSTGTAKLTIGGSTANTYTGLTRINAGPVELNKPAGVVAVGGDLQVFGGSVKLLADQQIADGGAVSVANAGSLLDFAGHSETVGALSVTGNASATAGATGTTSQLGTAVLRVTSLSVTTGGKLDLANNRLIDDYTGGTPITSIRTALLSGYAGGLWNGAGISSSSAIANPTRALGYAEATDVLPFANGASSDTFLGSTVDKTALLMRYTLSGDANLDGSVDFLDLSRLAQNYNVTDGTRTWAMGDYNYDGNVDFTDLAKLAQNYNVALPGGSAAIPGAPAGFEADLAGALANVPEPSLVGVLGLCVLAARNRRSNARWPTTGGGGGASQRAS